LAAHVHGLIAVLIGGAGDDTLWAGKGHTVAITVLHELEPPLGAAAANDDRFTKGKFA